MRLNFAKAALAAAFPVMVLAGPAMADEQHDKLLKMCQANDPAPETCECQVKALVENMEPKVLQAFVGASEASETAATPEEADAAAQAAVTAAGLTQEEFDKGMAEAIEKVGPAMEACKKS